MPVEVGRYERGQIVRGGIAGPLYNINRVGWSCHDYYLFGLTEVDSLDGSESEIEVEMYDTMSYYYYFDEYYFLCTRMAAAHAL